MRLRPPALEIPLDDPFRHDLLGRKESAETLTELIRSTDEPLVIGIDASWGQGKTTFLQMWMTHLQNAQVKAIYVNAWESDFSDSAFISIMGEIELGMAGLKVEKEAKAKRAFEAAKKVGAGVLKRGIPAVVKMATAGVLDADKLIEDAAAEAAENYAKDRIKQYEDAKKSVQAFREKLTDFARDVTMPSEGKEQAPLVIVLDELDRCRPSYAIDVLENIKHLFSVPGVVFVIAADWLQLGNVVKSRYGMDVDVDGYLRRFVDVSFVFPPHVESSFVDSQFKKFGYEEFFASRSGRESQYDRRQTSEVFESLFEATGCSLRDQERCFTLLGLAIRATPQNMLMYPILLVALIVLKVKNPLLYRKFMLREVTYREVIAYFSQHPSGKRLFADEYGYGMALEAYLRKAHVDGYREEPDTSDLQEVLASESASGSAKSRAKNMIDLFQSWEFRNHHNVHAYLLKKIDLVGEMAAQRRRRH